jgi:hypothetical protein
MKATCFALLLGSLAAVGCGHPSTSAVATPAPAPAPVSAAPSSSPRGTLSQSSLTALAHLKGPLNVDFYVTTGLPGLDRYVHDLTVLLREYEAAAGGKLVLTVLESTGEGIGARAKKAGLEELPFIEREASSEPVVKGYLGLQFRYGTHTDVIPQLSPRNMFGMEFWITNKLREICDVAEGTKRRIGVIAQKRELELDKPYLVSSEPAVTMQGVLQRAFPFYAIEKVDLRGGAARVDPQVLGLIVTQPQDDYTEEELRRIDEFVMLGGKAVALFVSAANVQAHDSSMVATLGTHGLERLTSGYGIAMNQDVIFDPGCAWTLPVKTPDATTTVTFSAILRLSGTPDRAAPGDQLDTRFGSFAFMEGVIFPFASSLTLMPQKQPAAVRIRAVAHTTADAWTEAKGPVDLSPAAQRYPKGLIGERTVAAVSEGQLDSVFRGKSPVAPSRASGFSRVLVVSSGTFLVNPFVYLGDPDPARAPGSGDGDKVLQTVSRPYAQRNLTNSILVVKNTLDWMTNDPDLLETMSKRLDEYGRGRSP